MNVLRNVVLCLAAAVVGPVAHSQPVNVLLVIADDLGLEAVPGFAPNAIKANMPTLQALAADGLSFDNVWSNPICSPTRATILTGKYGNRTGVLNVDALSRISADEKTLHEFIAEASDDAYASAIIGKWHLSGRNSTELDYPQTVGVPHYAGLITGAVGDYSDWTFTDNGVQMQSSEYITTQLTDLAIDWIAAQEQPWFLWLAYNAPHTPFHLPPLDLHSQGNLPTDQASIDANPLPYYLAMVESLDAEMGRLLANLSAAERANTVVIFVGDNGNNRQVLQAPYTARQGKGTLYQGGIHVPMVIAGAGVSRQGERESALINLTDLYATIIELSGSRIGELQDSKSFQSLLQQAGPSIRDLMFSEIADDNGVISWAARNADYKMIQADSTTEFYDLRADPYEQNELLAGGLDGEAQAAFSSISAGVVELLGAPTVDGSYSGSWYNVDRSGEGLLIEIVDVDNPTAVVSFYTYQGDGTGAQAWLFGAGPVSANSAEVDLVIPTGAQFGPMFDPDSVTRTPWGSVRLTFTSCTTATLDYSSDLSGFGSGSISLVRLTPPLLGVVGDCSG